MCFYDIYATKWREVKCLENVEIMAVFNFMTFLGP